MIKSLIISSKIILKQNSYINTEKVYVLFKITILIFKKCILIQKITINNLNR